MAYRSMIKVTQADEDRVGRNRSFYIPSILSPNHSSGSNLTIGPIPIKLDSAALLGMINCTTTVVDYRQFCMTLSLLKVYTLHRLV